MDVEWQRLRLEPPAAGGQVRHDRSHVRERCVVAVQGGARELGAQLLLQNGRFPAQADDVRAACRWLLDDHASPVRGLPLVVFGVFVTFYFGEHLRWNHAAAGVCLVAAAFFTFHSW